MKVLIFSNYSGSYGSERSLEDIVLAARQSAEVKVFMNPAVEIPEEYCEKNNVTSLDFNVFSKKNLLPSLKSIRLIAGVIKQEKADKVIANISLMPEVMIACFLVRKPLYLFVREALSDYGVFFKFYCLLVRLTCFKVVANSSFTASMFNNMKSVSIVPNCINTPSNIEAVDKQYDFIYVGRISERKGIETLCDALADLNEEISIAVLGGVKSGEEYLLDKLHMLPSNIKLTYLGFQSNPIDYIRKAKFMIAPSIEKETFGRVIIESCSVGVPVISSDAGAYKEINPFEELTFPAGDPNSLSYLLLKSIKFSHLEYESHRAKALSTAELYKFPNYQKLIEEVILND